MKCCQTIANKYWFIPFVTDCHNKIDYCLKANNLNAPYHSRFHEGTEGDP